MDVRWLFFSRNGIKMQFLGAVGFRSSALTVYCLSSWFVYQKQKYFFLICVSFVESVIYHDFKDLSTFYPLLCLKSQIMMLSQKCLGHCTFSQLFHDVEKLRRKPKKIVKVMQRFWYVQHVGFIFCLSTRSSQSCNFGKICQYWKNLHMFPSSRF